MTDTPETTETPAATAPAPEATATAAQPPAEAPAAPPAAETPAPAPKAEAKAGKAKEAAPPAETPAPSAEATPPAEQPKPEEKPPVAADFPDDWREKYAKGNEKKLAVLKRFASFETAMDSLFALRQKISTGEYAKALPADATEDQIAEWRKENGIPETPDAYKVELPDGIVPGEQDKPLVAQFLTEMHKSNAKPEHVNAALATYYRLVEQQQAEQDARNEQVRTQTEDALRAEWGEDFRRNHNMVKGLLATAPAGLVEKLEAARLPDGTRLGNHPEMNRFLAQLAREINPAATVVPGSGTHAAATIADELASLEKMMGDHASDYWKGPMAERNQNRYRELVAAREKLASR